MDKMLRHSQEKDLPRNMPTTTCIAYVTADDVKSFLASDVSYSFGYAYEWEGENVVHLHSTPLPHAFGIIHRCRYQRVASCSLDDFTDDIRYIIYIPTDTTESDILGFTLKDGKMLKFTCSVIPSHKEMYSRSKGLIEVDILARKHVIIVGLGSFGSQIAIELAKAGVGKFSLFDFDRVELHNLGRHTCTIKDLGRLKTDAIEEAILGKNPNAQVAKFPVNIVTDRLTFFDLLPSADIVICATDNNDSRFVISKGLYENKKVGIFGRAITRAAGGDVFRYTPGGPCYCCFLGTHLINPRDEEVSSLQAGRRSGAIPAYTSSEDANAIVQVGLSVDIEPICNMMLKVALVELSRGENSGISSLEEDLKYDAYIWANRRDNNFAAWHPFFKSGAKQTILKWYGITFPKNEHCPICSEKIKLDTGSSTKSNEYEEYANDDFGLDKN